MDVPCRVGVSKPALVFPEACCRMKHAVYACQYIRLSFISCCKHGTECICLHHGELVIRFNQEGRSSTHVDEGAPLSSVEDLEATV